MRYGPDQLRRRGLGLLALVALLASTALPVAARQASPAAGPSEELSAAPPGKTELIVGQSADVTTLDPQLSTVSNDIFVTFNLFDNLVFRARDLSLQPMLATEWNRVDDLTWEFRLREGITFHNGEPFGADDVEFTIERTYDPAATTRVATVFATVQDVQVVDDLTVRFLTKAPDPLLPGRLAFYGGQMLPRDYFNEVGAEQFGQAPVGTGPVRFAERVPDERLVLDRNDEYWGGPINVERVVFRPIPEVAARIAALETGEVDIITRVPPDQVEQVANLENARVEQVLYNGLNVLVANVNREPLDDPLVRQALSLAIDREAILEELFGGQGQVPTGPAIDTQFAYNPDLDPLAYDPDRARQLLEQAGYDGTPVVIETTNGSIINDQAMAEAIGAMWEEVGVTVDLQVIEASVRAQKNSEKSFLGLFWSDPTDTLADPDGMMWRLLSPGGQQDYFRQEEWDRLGNEARVSLDPEQRRQNYYRMYEIFLENFPWIPVIRPYESYGVANYVEWYPFANQYFNLRADNLRIATE
ncbi:MAG: ABC transporter substrate-binding protein [Chloroflexota bacterium]|nr:ABC transporter substrate-binding protein [Chloroflexota bacterium]